MKLPQQKNMPDWIQKKSREMGGQFKPAAAETLAEMVGTDTSQAIQEIEKLLTYVDFKSPVEVQDVKNLTASGLQSNVFELLDAVSEGSPARAVKNLEGLLEQSDATSLFFMLVRQFRLLLQAREILDEGGAVSNIQAELNQPKFVAEKLHRQARRFSMHDLEAIYHHLLTLDEEIKTSRTSALLGIQLLVAEISAK
jgi:DNA polymerase-3 subunit delta